MIIFFLSAALLQIQTYFSFFFFKVGIFLVFLLANAAKIKSQQVQGDENSGGAETGHTLQPYLGKIILKKLFSCLVILSIWCHFCITFASLLRLFWSFCVTFASLWPELGTLFNHT